MNPPTRRDLVSPATNAPARIHPLQACQATSTKEKHVKEQGFQETDKESSVAFAQGKEGGEAGEEEELIRWRASSFDRATGPVSRD